MKPLILKLIKIVKIWNVIINSETTDIKVTNVDTDMTETIAKTFVEHSLLLLINILSNMWLLYNWIVQRVSDFIMLVKWCFVKIDIVHSDINDYHMISLNDE